ncbi:MAG: DUF3179 domain-containing (seleno)protein [bacterium]
MRKSFCLGVLLLVVFEVLNVYFIMPMPGSQTMQSIDVAFFLYRWRWAFRVVSVVLIAIGAPAVLRKRGVGRVLAPLSIALAGMVVYAFNFKMSADAMFLQPTAVTMRGADRNSVAMGRLVVGVELHGDARAYPIQFIGYHHQVRDMVGGTPVLVTFCTVCRTGRVFAPIVDGKPESFRLVGMDHFNAMFEDNTTGSWWRQANGEAIAGAKTGAFLPEIPSVQVTLAQWLALHPASLIMQPDATMADHYATTFDYETGASRSSLTGTDSVSWRDKAWVVGLEVNRASRAYDWNRLRRERVVNDNVGGTPIVLALASDQASFFAFERPGPRVRFELKGDSLVSAGQAYALSGQGASGSLRPVFASQEFWHSWRTFHPGTTTY